MLELHGESLLKDYMDVELWVCPRCGRIAFFMREKDRKDRYRAECGGRDDDKPRKNQPPEFRACPLTNPRRRRILLSIKPASTEKKPQSTAQRGTHFGASVLRERRPYHSRAARDERDGFARYSGHKRRKRASRVEPWSIAMLHP